MSYKQWTMATAPLIHFRCEEKRNLTAKLLPKRPARALLSTLERLHQKVIQTAQASYVQDSNQDDCIDRDFQNKRKEVRIRQGPFTPPVSNACI